MKHVNLKKAVEKFAPVQEKLGKCNKYFAICENYMIEWCVTWYEKDTQEASLVRVRHLKDQDEIQSDYFGGSFYDTIKSAIFDFTYDLRKGEVI